MTPAKGFAEMKDSGIHWMGGIPKHWNLIRAKFHFTQTNNRGNETPILLAASQKYGVCPQSWLEGVVQVSENTDLQQFKTVHKNDFVISLRSFQGGFERSDFEGVCSPAYQVFHADNSFDNNFLKYLFKNELFIDEMNSLTVGIREGRNIKYEDFANSLIFVPPLDEQSAIASYLDAQCAKIDEIIAQAKASIEDYKQWKASIIYEAVTKGLDPNAEMKDSGIEWIGEVPRKWKTPALKYLCSMQAGKNLTSEQISPLGEYPVYGGNGLRGFYSDYNADGDYLLVGRQGALCGNVHRVKGKFWATEHAVLTKAGEGTNIGFLFYLLMAMNLNQYASNSAAQPGLSVGNVVNIRAILPPVNEQEKIETFLDMLCHKIDELMIEKQSLIDDLEAYKKSLIYEVVTGKRSVN